jgi:hypothetical protein
MHGATLKMKYCLMSIRPQLLSVSQNNEILAISVGLFMILEKQKDGLMLLIQTLGSIHDRKMSLVII